ncbi:MAG: CBS domain-containing protein [Flavobacteriaceae bacterium]|nr:CBS domain-containing protein [Flavobacteriaceae bacterium]|tara:strand:+ start:250360 stop:252240 length:1881 start_codon:yes stop_codon:yes gene_type:complete
MGSLSVKAIKTAQERIDFERNLINDIHAFEYMLNHNLFEDNIKRVGAEQEICIVDDKYRPSLNALNILEKINDPHYTSELALFNLEINLDPFELKENCFSLIEQQLQTLLKKGRDVAGENYNDRFILTGILPTLQKKDLVFDNITPYQRYRTLNDVIKNIRGDEFKLHIRGLDELIVSHESILFEACNTSFQVHLQVSPQEAIDKFNWAQAISGPVLSVMTNSPMLFGKELWSETRIALFRQSIDQRNNTHILREQKPRVSFGQNWIKNSILEIFTDDIARYAPILSTDFEENSFENVKNGIMPKLRALNLHNGTLYKWNRLCYGVHQNVAHLRIENRYIPSGPSVKDEIANSLFWVGLMEGMPDKYKNIWKVASFNDARVNFLNAARTGIDTYFNWFGKGISARKLVKTKLLPMAKEGLLKNNIDKAEIDYYLDIIYKRIENNATGSKWLKISKDLLRKECSVHETNLILTKQIIDNQEEGKPVAEWKPVADCKNELVEKYNKLYKVMSTELFVVNENDLVSLAAKIMEWKSINHLPVVDDQNSLVGIILKDQLTDSHLNSDTIAKEIMNMDFIAASPETLLEEAIEKLKKNKTSCLPVIDNNILVGIFTNNDLLKIERLKAQTS